MNPTGSNPTPPQQVYYAPPQIVMQQRGIFQRFVGWLGWVAFMVCAVILMSWYVGYREYFNNTGAIRERYHSGKEAFGTDKVAIITIKGVLISGEGYIRHQIDQVRKDKTVKAVVVRVDSPGGTVTASDYVYHHLNQLRIERKIPVVVSMGSVAASGGYYVSMAVGDQERSIYAEPTSTTGSIGVMIPHYDLSGLLQKLDVKDDSIATHPRKLMLSMTKPIPDEHRALIAEHLNESLTRFKDIIKAGRPAFQQDPSKLDELATGEVFTANQAKKHGLIDEIGFLEEVIERACEMAGVSPDEIRVVTFDAPTSLLDFGGFVKASRSPDLSALLDLGTPRAYYLASFFPALVTAYEGE